MTKKIVGISLLTILALGILFFIGSTISDNIRQKEAIRQEAREMHYYLLYDTQNKVFNDSGEGKYVTYKKEYENELQIDMCAYIRATGKTITLSDVETFLATSENPDGTPRTWEDDETGIIKDYVNWHRYNKSLRDEYRSALGKIFMQYIKENLECPYEGLSFLSPEQILELDKKYADPDYDLVLEW